MQSDACKQEFNPDNEIGNNDEINNNIISEIEKELTGNPYDMISLVFLLYDEPHDALQRLIVFQRVSKDIDNSANLLHDWFQHAKHTPTWKHEFIEALLLCQLNSVVRKFGFQLPAARKHYQLDNFVKKMYINPVKKALYKLCETINADNLLTLRNSLMSYDNIDTTEYDSCELIFLRLMCDKFITVDQNNITFGFHVNLDKLLRIIDELPGLQKIGQDIRNLQHTLNEETKPSAPIAVSTPNTDKNLDKFNQNKPNSPLYNVDFKDEFNMNEELKLTTEDNNSTILKADRAINLDEERFEIKNTKILGVCVILNQEEFHISKNSIENGVQYSPLPKRLGSTKDKAIIEKTMTALNFSVYSKDNLDYENMIQYLKDVLKHKVIESDSVFMLCILSHGVKGHIYAADSVKVNVDVFQKLLESEHAKNLYGKPKLIIIQACQIEDPLNCNAMDKTNFLTYWATAPELEAYRDENNGSIFIQILFSILREYANKEHIEDIFRKVRNKVKTTCKLLDKNQVPWAHTTMLKKLYLKVPD